jgi:hypothetical protein
MLIVRAAVDGPIAGGPSSVGHVPRRANGANRDMAFRPFRTHVARSPDLDERVDRIRIIV